MLERFHHIQGSGLLHSKPGKESDKGTVEGWAYILVAFIDVLFFSILLSVCSVLFVLEEHACYILKLFYLWTIDIININKVYLKEVPVFYFLEKSNQLSQKLIKKNGLF